MPPTDNTWVSGIQEKSSRKTGSDNSSSTHGIDAAMNKKMCSSSSVRCLSFRTGTYNPARDIVLNRLTLSCTITCEAVRIELETDALGVVHSQSFGKAESRSTRGFSTLRLRESIRVTATYGKLPVLQHLSSCFWEPLQGSVERLGRKL
jgi:hypothetical protein